MASPYDPVLTGIGLINNGKISNEGKRAFVLDVVQLLVTGNKDGQGLLSPIVSVLPIPPVAGPDFPTIYGGKEKLFWFDPDPLAVGMSAVLPFREKTPFWHAVFIDMLYEKTMLALDLPGQTPLFPIFDASGPFDVKIPLPFTLPELAAELAISPPKLNIKLAQAKIKLSIPNIPAPPSLNLPKVELDILPRTPDWSFVIPDLILGLVKLPFDLLLNLVASPSLDLINPIEMPKLVFNLALDALLALLEGLGLLVSALPKMLIATMIVYMKNVIAAICVVLIGQMVGTGGLCKTLGVGLGLIK